MAVKPTQVRAVAELLETGDFDNPTDAAKAAINLIDQLRAEDVTHIVVVQYDATSGPTYQGYGPYATRNQAFKALEKGAVGVPGYGKKAVVPLRHPNFVAARQEEIDSVRVKEMVGG